MIRFFMDKYIYMYSILQHMHSSSHHLILTLLINHLTSCYPSRLVPPSTERGDITNIHLNVQNKNFSKPELTWFSICMFRSLFLFSIFGSSFSHPGFPSVRKVLNRFRFGSLLGWKGISFQHISCGSEKFAQSRLVGGFSPTHLNKC